jgi:hypothetical protein
VNNRPAKDWVRSFKDRWSHRVKVRKPTNIRRSRAKVRYRYLGLSIFKLLVCFESVFT